MTETAQTTKNLPPTYLEKLDASEEIDIAGILILVRNWGKGKGELVFPVCTYFAFKLGVPHMCRGCSGEAG